MLQQHSIEYGMLIRAVNRLRFSGRQREAIAMLEPRLQEMDYKTKAWSLILLILAAGEGGLSDEELKFALTLEIMWPGFPCARRVLMGNVN